MKILKRFGACAALTALIAVTQIHAQPIAWDGYRSTATTRGSIVLLPKDARGPLPVLVLLPFTGGTARDLLERWYARSLPPHAAARNLVVVIPASRGSSDDYASGEAWSATIARYSKDLEEDVEEVLTSMQGDRRRVALAGFSMGGDLAWALMQRDRDRYSGAIVMGSRATYRAKGSLEHLARRGFKLFWFMGESEAEARMSGAKAAQTLAKGAGITLRTARSAGEHVTAPPTIFGDAIDMVFSFSGPRPPSLAQSPRLMDSTDSEDWDPPTDTEEAEEPTSRQMRLPGIVDVRALMRNPSAQRHPLRTAGTVERPEQLVECALEPFEDDRNFSGWGYRNERGQTVIQPRFSNADAFDESGLALVWDDVEDGPGYIDCKGRFFNVFYERAPDEFSDELVRFQDYTYAANGDRVHLLGFLNRRGEVFLPARYEYATSFCDGVSRVGSGCAFDVRGIKLREVQCTAWRYIDLRGATVKSPKVDPECGEILVEPRANDEYAKEWFLN